MKSESSTLYTPALSALQVARYLLPVLVLGLAIHLLLPMVATFEHSFEVIRSMIPWALALAGAAQMASYVGSGYLLKALVQLSGSSLSLFKGTLITLAGASFGMVAGGMVGSSAAIYHWMQKEQVRSESATLAGTAPAAFNNAVLLSLSLIGVIYLLSVHQLSRLQAVSFALVLTGLLSVIGLLLWGLQRREALTRLAGWGVRRASRLIRRPYQPQKTGDWLNGLFAAADLLLAGGWRGPLLGASLNVAFDMLTLYTLFIAAGHPVNPAVLLTGYGLPLLLGKMAFIIPGGIGVIESAMVGLYTSLGVANPVAVVVVLAYRILSFWLPLIIGFPLILILQRKQR
jgi:uncharacterized protein (TIRG00374 family)